MRHPVLLRTAHVIFPSPSFALVLTSLAFAQREDPHTGASFNAFYPLGPDSLPMGGVPQSKFSEAKVFPSQVFPGYQPTYRGYVPAQYDPTVPIAVMVCNDGAARRMEAGDVRGHQHPRPETGWRHLPGHDALALT